MEIILYSTHCPKCKVLELKLKNKKVGYITIDNVDIMKQKGFMSAPILEVDGVVMEYKTAIEWLKNI